MIPSPTPPRRPPSLEDITTIFITIARLEERVRRLGDLLERDNEITHQAVKDFNDRVKDLELSVRKAELALSLARWIVGGAGLIALSLGGIYLEHILS